MPCGIVWFMLLRLLVVGFFFLWIVFCSVFIGVSVKCYHTERSDSCAPILTNVTVFFVKRFKAVVPPKWCMTMIRYVFFVKFLLS